MDPQVKLLNPMEVNSLLANVGYFASVCKPGAKNPSKEAAERIGLSCINATHYSPSRWIYIVFNVSNISRVCSHQLVRHSMGTAINQQSGVFGDTDVDDWVLPDSYNKLDPELLLEINQLLTVSGDVYKKLRASGISSSDARYIVPQCSTTSMNIGFTLEALMNLCNRRLCMRAQPEIRQVAQKMRDEIVKVIPELKHLFVPMCVKLHGCPEVKSCGYYTDDREGDKK